MSYYNDPQWSAPSSQSGWESQTPPARSGASSVVSREESSAFSSQLEEVDRAVDNLIKSGKMFPSMNRRDSVPVQGSGRGGQFNDQFDPRMMGGASRHHSTDFGSEGRSFSGSSLQNFYANQRHQNSRTGEAEQVLQAKRRMAAQRERELRNYHQEQQYNRSVLAEMSGFNGKPDRALSPGNAMTEEERRDLIARQRSALYGEGALEESGSPRASSQTPGSSSLIAGRGHSPLTFGAQNQPSTESNTAAGEQAAPNLQRSRANSTSSPSNTNNFSLFDNAAQQSSRTSTSSPGTSPPRQGGKGAPGAGVAPIGTRPAATTQAQALGKRSTTPLPSPLSFGYAAGAEDKTAAATGVAAANNAATGNRSASAGSNSAASTAQDSSSSNLAWGSSNKGSGGGVWGKNSSLGVQASVWG